MLGDILVSFFQVFCVVLVFGILIGCGKAVLSIKKPSPKNIVFVGGAILSAIVFIYLWVVLGWAH